MKKRITAVMMFAAAVLIFSYVSGAEAGKVCQLNEGDRAPAIIMRASNGDSFILSKQGKVKPVLISFFSDNCLPCLKEIPELQKIKNSSDRTDVYLVADTATDEKRAAEFLEKTGKQSGMKITLPVVYDSYGDMKGAFGVKSYPVLFLVDRKGVVVLRFDGYKPENIEKLNRLLKEFK